MGRVIDKSLKEKIRSDYPYCYYCGRKLTDKNRTCDHIVPVNKGGKDSMDNLVACCYECNQIKKNYTLYELIEELNRQKKFCDDDVRMAALEYHEKIFSIARQKLMAK